MSDMNDHHLTEVLVARMRELSRSLHPEPTGHAPALKPLRGIRAVLFDVYGTLVISASGDVGTALAVANETAMRDALVCAGFPKEAGTAAPRGVALLFEHIEDAHARRRAEGVEHPEVDIREIWRQVFAALEREGLIAEPPSGPDVLRFAVGYECRVNPVWPMPGAADTLSRLRERGIRLGIVSNAQFFTPLIFPALMGGPAASMGFDPAFCAWSFEVLEAKPSVRLFARALDALGRRYGIRPDEVTYVGNDMRNDIWPASECGCRTALFAGDRRSLRLRSGDEHGADVPPDLVLTELRQLERVLSDARNDAAPPEET